MNDFREVFDKLNESLERLEAAIKLEIEMEKAELKARESEGARNA